ncbi:MAG TPA: DUF177 domain-containing protein [Clostridia bacterium]|nr:DUF177 domain-containing protein [Clostridia bacterium]
MKANIASLLGNVGATASFHFSENMDSIIADKGEARLARPVLVDVSLLNTGNRLLADFDVRADVVARCSRCLSEFTFPIRLKFKEEYKKAPETALKTQRLDGSEKPAGTGEAEDEAGNEIFAFYGDNIDFKEAVRQNLILALPMKFVCREACRGLCPVCGKNLNEGECGCSREEDSRWSPLRDVLDNLYRQSKS